MDLFNIIQWISTIALVLLGIFNGWLTGRLSSIENNHARLRSDYSKSEIEKAKELVTKPELEKKEMIIHRRIEKAHRQSKDDLKEVEARLDKKFEKLEALLHTVIDQLSHRDA